MSRWRSWVAYPVVWILSLAWFAFFQPWGGFNDPDAFYHAKIASLMSEQGPLHVFPWLDLTLFDKGFSDHHFLFHLLLIPFVRSFGMLSGTQIAAVLFAASFILLFYAVLRSLKITHPAVWTFLAAISSPLLVRLSLGKASPLALAWFVLGLGVMLNAIRTSAFHPERSKGSSVAPARSSFVNRFLSVTRFVAFFIGFGYSWSHGGWVILLVGQVILLKGAFLVDWLVFDRPWKESLKHLPWMTLCFTAWGAVIGTALHPNFPQNVLFLKTLLVDISFRVPFGHVQLGDEWQPSSFLELWGGLGPLFAAGFLIVYGMLFAIRHPLDEARAKQGIGLGILTGLFLALTFKSRRAVEYLVPVLALWLSVLWTCVDSKKCFVSLWEDWKRLTKKWSTLSAILLLAIIISVHGYDLGGLWKTFRTSRHGFQEFKPAMNAIMVRAKEGDRVFHSDWDQFPQLWALNDRVHYIVGLDPTLLWVTHPELSDTYRDVALGATSTRVFEEIQNTFHARFVFLERAHHEAFEKKLETDSRFIRFYQDDKTAAYELSTASH